ncbi:pilin, partial [Candidatus Marithioploca araucensis]|nr:pilin [Candidatus Marithioploca araucensis]
GIMAAVAIPAYTVYMKRSKVAEAMRLMAGLKTPAQEYMGAKGFNDHVPLIVSIGGKTSGKYTSIIKQAGMCYTASMRDNSISPNSTADVAKLCYDTVSTNWTCGKDGAFQDKYLPSNCR